MANNALIIGHTGQDGYYMTQLLRRSGMNVYGVSRSSADICCDISDYDSVASAVKRLLPEYIFHLAASTSRDHKFLFENNTAIGTGTCNILEAARKHAPNARIFISGSASQFKNCGQPIDEASPFEALSSYAAVRNYAVHMARYFRQAFSLKTYIGFFFTHESPRRSGDYLSQKIATAARDIAQGKKYVLEIGDITVRREFMFAEDAVNAAWILVNQDKIFEAVIGTGLDYSIEQWIAKCFSIVGLDWRRHTTMKKNFKPDYQRLVSNPRLINSLGWKPAVCFEEMARMMVEEQ